MSRAFPQIGQLQQLDAETTRPAPGQIWVTQPLAEFPVESASSEDEVEPHWVILLEYSGYEVQRGGKVFLAAPIYTHTAANLGPDDLLFTKSVFGFECAAAVGCAIQVAEISLKSPIGALPESQFSTLSAFHGFLLGNNPRPTNVLKAPPYIGDDDIRLEFKDQLIEDMEYLQAPLAAMVAAELESEEPAFMRRVSSFIQEWLGLDSAMPSLAFQGSTGRIQTRLAFINATRDEFVEVVGADGVAPQPDQKEFHVLAEIETEPRDESDGGVTMEWETKGESVLVRSLDFAVLSRRSLRLLAWGKFTDTGRFASITESLAPASDFEPLNELILLVFNPQ
jgi:hypothetical protein